MRVDLFDYELPPDRIAQRPAKPRDSSRLLVLNRLDQSMQHRIFRDLPEFLTPHDTLVVNDTRVIAARLFGLRRRTGGQWEGLFLSESPEGWELMAKTRGKPQPGEIIDIDGAPWHLTLLRKTDQGHWMAAPSINQPADQLLSSAGHIPLPPYIREGKGDAADKDDYQTIYAEQGTSVAAPTAGLHFTPELLARIEQMGIPTERVTLHVGAGTFLPVTAEDTSYHQMHQEWCELSPRTASVLSQRRQWQGRIIAVGTTVVRTLETAAAASNEPFPQEGFRGSTQLFIVPPYSFRAVDGLITNFHLPKSTLLMLVSALAGADFILEAYREAVRLGYRFYSYGDAMLIL